jgi:hypothetical protein
MLLLGNLALDSFLRQGRCLAIGKVPDLSLLLCRTGTACGPAKPNSFRRRVAYRAAIDLEYPLEVSISRGERNPHPIVIHLALLADLPLLLPGMSARLDWRSALIRLSGSCFPIIAAAAMAPSSASVAGNALRLRTTVSHCTILVAERSDRSDVALAGLAISTLRYLLDQSNRRRGSPAGAGRPGRCKAASLAAISTRNRSKASA